MSDSVKTCTALRIPCSRFLQKRNDFRSKIVGDVLKESLSRARGRSFDPYHTFLEGYASWISFNFLFFQLGRGYRYASLISYDFLFDFSTVIRYS